MRECKNGHGQFDGRRCLICHQENSVRYRLNHPEKIKAYTKKYSLTLDKTVVQQRLNAYAIAHPERISAAKAKWRANNPEQMKACRGQWKQRNLHKYPAYKQNRRGREAQGAGVSFGLVALLLVSQDGECVYCQAALEHGYHLDHRMPLALGGANEDDNMQLLCPTCNLRKGAKHPDVFAKEQACRQ